MLLKFINATQNLILTTYHIEVNFKTREKKPTTYKLQLIAELRNCVELEALKNSIIQQITDNFDLISNYETEIRLIADRIQIENNFQQSCKESVPMKFSFKHWVADGYGQQKYIKDEMVEKSGKKDFRVNVLKIGEIPFETIKDLFAIEIDTTEFTKMG